MDESDAPGLRSDCQDVWARYIAKWISAYKAHGIPVWAITIQNEPTWNASGYEACLYTPSQEAEFLGNFLGPTMRALHPDVAILAYDHNKQVLDEWASTMYTSEVAAPFVDGVAFHWYTGDHFGEIASV